MRELFLILSLSLCSHVLSAQTTTLALPTVTTAASKNLAPSAAAAIAAPHSLEAIVPNRLVVFYRGGVVPGNADTLAAKAGTTVVSHMHSLGLSSLQVDGDAGTAAAALLAQPEVSAVLHDRYVSTAHLTLAASQQQAARQTLPTLTRATTSTATAQPNAANSSTPLPQSPHLTATIARPVVAPETDIYYNSMQGWATILSGGYGKGVPGGPADGPWDISMGAGVRIAILDSGVDALHPGIAPNLVLNLTEVQQSVLPSVCDDGSPADQTGHGTFTASLAAAAQGLGTGMVIGVAPQASILNIKVVERLPGSGATTAAQCEAGDAAGLLSWVLQGIQDAISNHADIISASLGTLVDTTTGDGAGWVAQMDSVTYAAAQAGVVIIAAAGNDSLDLTNSKYLDLPAQARNVLPVVASTNPACSENLNAGATCVPGPVGRAYYSNHGTSLNAIAAPGGSLPAGSANGNTGFVRGACSSGLPNTIDGPPGVKGQSMGCFGFGHLQYIQAIGTSASAPLVAGAAAILKATFPSWTPAQIISALQSTANPTGNLTEPELNLPAALALEKH